MSTSSPTSFADIHPLIIQTQILPRLDGQSLSCVATASSYLRTVCADDLLWSNICESIWPSITHPRVHQVISTFPAGHRSFFQDSFMPITNDVKQPNIHRSQKHHLLPSELMSAIDIRYHDEIVFSKVEFTDTTNDFRSSALRIVSKNVPDVVGMAQFIDLKVDELLHADHATISHLKESITLNWILIDPTRKRAVNVSSIKPLLAWISNINDIHLGYTVVLPGTDSNELVECRIEVTLTFGKGGVALHVGEVILHLQDLACNCLSGLDFLVITSRAFSERSNIRNAATGDEGRCHENRWVKEKDTGRVWVDDNYFIPLLFLLLSFCFWGVYCNVI